MEEWRKKWVREFGHKILVNIDQAHTLPPPFQRRKENVNKKAEQKKKSDESLLSSEITYYPIHKYHVEQNERQQLSLTVDTYFTTRITTLQVSKEFSTTARLCEAVTR